MLYDKKKGQYGPIHEDGSVQGREIRCRATPGMMQIWKRRMEISIIALITKININNTKKTAIAPQET
jgi:hypothetical protein